MTSTRSCWNARTIDLYATHDHGHRLQLALRLSKERELLEDKLATGRLELHIHEQPLRLAEELLPELNLRPVHVLAIFDEATIRIRRSGMGRLLPMSPFCVRQQIRFLRLEKVVQLEPTSDEPPFSEFMQLVNEAERGQRDRATRMGRCTCRSPSTLPAHLLPPISGPQPSHESAQIGNSKRLRRRG